MAAAAATSLQQRVLSFWFKDFVKSEPVPPTLMKLWFQGGQEVDDVIRRDFGADFNNLLDAQSPLDPHLRQSPEGTLASILVLDQFTRNMYRKSPHAFAGDAKALELCHFALDRGYDMQLHPIESVFLYMPLEHSERVQDQERCVSLMQALEKKCEGSVHLTMVQGFTRFAQEHRDVIKEFGRFPHRNDVLGRSSTAAELAYLSKGANRYGQ